MKNKPRKQNIANNKEVNKRIKNKPITSLKKHENKQ